MDDIVRAALKKWPSVPDCRGWLGLDARGNWYLRDDRVQAAGPFPRVKGSLLRHEKLREFIHRNYEANADGAWFFQNGPQRVYVELEAAPLIYGIERAAGGGFALEAHTGARAKRVLDSWVDESGRLFVTTDLGFGRLRGAPHAEENGPRHDDDYSRYRQNSSHHLSPPEIVVCRSCPTTIRNNTTEQHVCWTRARASTFPALDPFSSL